MFVFLLPLSKMGQCSMACSQSTLFAPHSHVLRSLGTRAHRLVSNSTGEPCVLARSIHLRSVTSCPRAICQSPLHCGRVSTPAISSLFELHLFAPWRCFSAFRNSCVETLAIFGPACVAEYGVKRTVRPCFGIHADDIVHCSTNDVVLTAVREHPVSGPRGNGGIDDDYQS